LTSDLPHLASQLGHTELVGELARLPLAELRALDADAMRASFAEFVKSSWPIVEPAQPLIWGWHMDAVCVHLEAVYRGDIQRLLINIPPGHAKSLLVAVLWPAWIWTNQSEWRSLFASYSAELSVRDSVRCRQVIESEWYRECFSAPAGWRLSDDQNVKHNYVNTRNGHRYSTSVGGGGTGHRGDAVVIDDPLSVSGAHSKAARDEANRWLGQTMSSRLNDMATGRMVMIMQRVHEDDPSNFVLNGGTGRAKWEHVMLPSEFETSRRCITHCMAQVPGGFERREFWKDPRTADGELLFPEKFSREVIDAAKAPNQLGSYGYAGQHQQRPSPAAGAMFKREWFKTRWMREGNPKWARLSVEERELYVPLPSQLTEVLSADCSFKDTAGADFVSMQAWGAAKSKFYLLDRIHDRLGLPETVRCLQALATRRPRARGKLIEDKANGPAVEQMLRDKMPGIIMIEPDGGKIARWNAVTPLCEAGSVIFPDESECPWIGEVIEELVTVPFARNDDDADAMAQALRYLHDRDPGRYLEAMKRVADGGVNLRAIGRE
jgi:predicted phage terminase large subunit-like protein